MKKAVGFRQYLNSKKSYKDLEQLIFGQQEYFNPDKEFVTIIVICGDNPLSFLKQKQMDQDVELYSFSVWEEKAAKVAYVYLKSRINLHKVQIIHYSEKPEDLHLVMVLMCNILGRNHIQDVQSDPSLLLFLALLQQFPF